MSSASDSVAANVATWTRRNGEFTDASAERSWRSDEIRWGEFGNRESDLNVLGDVAGLDIVELGCGTAYFGAKLARLGARVVGVDPTAAQLDTARRMMREVGPEFPLVEAPGESVPLPDASFDVAISEHGACVWADPYLWVPEAARLLRPGGRLVFLHATPLAYCCFPDVGTVTTTLQRPYFGVHRVQWPDDESVEYQLSHADWIAVLRSAGFTIERLVEVQAPAGATTHEYYADLTAEWARRWPGLEIWVARKR
jgi:SAM-dependent methyltransferase